MLQVLLRSFIRWLCRGVGIINGFLRSVFVLNVLLLVTIAVGIWMAEDLVQWLKHDEATLGWLTTWNVLSVWAFGLVVWWVRRTRRNLVIEKFQDFEENKVGTVAEGFDNLLTAELARIGDLFSEFDVNRAIQATPEPLQGLNATAHAEGLGQFLESAVSAESTFTLGPVKIPVGIVMGLVGKLVQGPRLSGQIYREGNLIIVMIQLSGRVRARSWRITRPVPPDESGVANRRLTVQLAHEAGFRIFADLVMGGTVHWRALSKFTQGLRKYRVSLRTPKNHKLNLQEAERCFVETIALDAHFDLAYYNLGVVYMELKQLDAAGEAYAKAIGENNRRWSTYYALAQDHFTRGNDSEATLRTRLPHYSKAIDFCDRAIRLAPVKAVAAQVLNLKTVAQYHLGGLSADQTLLKATGRTARRAVSESWLALCRAELGAEAHARHPHYTSRTAKGLASSSLQTLSQILLEALRFFRETAQVTASGSRDQDDTVADRPAVKGHGFIRRMVIKKGVWSLRQARSLTPWVQEIHLNLGQFYLEQGSNEKAIKALRTAVRTNPNSADPWGYLALANARLNRETRVFEAYNRVFDNVSTVSSPSMLQLTEALRILQDRARDLQSFLANIDELYGKRGIRRTLWLLWRGPYWAHRLAGRRIGDIGFGLSVLAGYVHKRASPDIHAYFDENDKRLVNLAERARALKPLQDRVKENLKKGAEGISPLVKSLEETAEPGKEWERGEVATALAKLHLDEGQPKEAEKYLQIAIEVFGSAHDGEIVRRGLLGLLTKSLRLQGRGVEALQVAQAAVAADPVGPYERTELGWAYYYLADYASARHAWEGALQWSPDDPQLHVNLGLGYVAALGEAKDKSIRAEILERMTEHLENALRLFKLTDERRIGASYLLTQAHFWAGRYTDAIAGLRILERSEYYKLVVAIKLADTHLGNDDLEEAERRFREISADVGSRIASAERGVNEPVETPPGEEMTLGTVSTFAHLGVAHSLAAREVRLDEALSHVGQARQLIADMNEPKFVNLWTGNTDLIEGEILRKQDKIEEACRKLESALAASPSASAYYNFAAALVRKIESAAANVDTSPVKRRARRYCANARRIDWTGEFEDKITELLERLV